MLLALLGNEAGEALDGALDEACASLGSQYRLLNQRLEARLLQFANDPMEQSLLESIEVFIQAYFDVLCSAEAKPCSALELTCKLSAHRTAMPEMLMLVEYLLGKQRRYVLPELERLALVTSGLTSEWLETVAIPSGLAVLASCTAQWLRTGEVPLGCEEFFFIRDAGPATTPSGLLLSNARFSLDVWRLPPSLAESWAREVLFCGLGTRFLSSTGTVAEVDAALQDLAQQEFDAHSQVIRNALFLGQANVFSQPLPVAVERLWSPVRLNGLDSCENHAIVARQDGKLGPSRAWFLTKLPIDRGFCFSLEVQRVGEFVSMWVGEDEALCLVIRQDSMVLRCHDVVLYQAERELASTDFTLAYALDNTLRLEVGGVVEATIPVPPRRLWADSGGNCLFGLSFGTKSAFNSFRVVTPQTTTELQPRLNVALLVPPKPLLFTFARLETWNAGAFPVLFRAARTSHLLSQRGFQPALFAYRQVSQAVLQYLHVYVVDRHFAQWRAFLQQRPPPSWSQIDRFSTEMTSRLNFECCLGNSVCRQALFAVLGGIDRLAPVLEFARLVRHLLATLRTSQHAPELVDLINFNYHWQS